jgi:hypothetical protein
MPWAVKSFRITLFPAPEATVWAVPNFERVVGIAPTEVVQNPGQKLEAAAFHAGQIQLQWLLNPQLRTDIAFMLEPSQAAVLELRQTLDFISREFEGMTASLLGFYPDVGRVAVGAELADFAESAEDSYAKLKAHIGEFGPRFSPRMRDFHYQVNRRRPSTVIPELILNRLCRWAALGWLLPDPKTGQIREDLRLRAATLEADFNSQPEYAGTFSAEQAMALVGELTGLLREVSDRGDIP